MENIIEFLKSDISVLILSSISIILLIGFIIIVSKFYSINKKYKKFLDKLGNGNDIQEDLETFMYRVEKVEQQNAQTLNYVKEVDKEMEKCIQKIGIVRYNAYKDMGSDLSFALAMLDENDDGIVLNGIYSREMSNIYAKPVEKGKSSYTITDEEKQAIEKAINTKNKMKME